MRNILVTGFALIGLAGCQALPEAEAPTSVAPLIQGPAAIKPTATTSGPATTLSFAQAACGDCHAVEMLELSPNPSSPTFEEIVNRPGLTKETLSAFLTDAHSYPEVMDFDINAPRIENLVDYMLTMRHANGRTNKLEE